MEIERKTEIRRTAKSKYTYIYIYADREPVGERASGRAADRWRKLPGSGSNSAGGDRRRGVLI